MTKKISTREKVIGDLEEIIASESIKESDRLRAIDILSQIHNLYDSSDDMDYNKPVYIVTGARPAQWQNLKIFVEKKKLHQLEKWNKIRKMIPADEKMQAVKTDEAGNILEEEAENTGASAWANQKEDEDEHNDDGSQLPDDGMGDKGDREGTPAGK